MTGSLLDLFAEELSPGHLELEELPVVSMLCTWSGFSTFGSASCPGSTASTGSTASSYC